MAHRTPPRNRLAKLLPSRWRDWLRGQDVPPRKCTVVATATLSGGELVRDLVIEEGWIIAIGTAVLADDVFEQRIPFDVERIAGLTIEVVI